MYDIYFKTRDVGDARMQETPSYIAESVVGSYVQILLLWLLLSLSSSPCSLLLHKTSKLMFVISLMVFSPAFLATRVRLSLQLARFVSIRSLPWACLSTLKFLSVQVPSQALPSSFSFLLTVLCAIYATFMSNVKCQLENRLASLESL